MNKMIASLFATALAGSASAFAGAGAPAPTAKDIAVAVDEVNYVQTAQKGIVLSGYVDAGYTYNFVGHGNVYGAGASTTKFPSDNTNRGDFNLNALKIALEKPLTDENKLQAGFRADLMFGEDAAALGGTGAGGLTAGPNSSNILLEQAYAQFRLPLGNGVDVKVGKFVTTLGYEVIERPANLNITYGNLFQNAIPLYHTGFLTSYKVNDIVDVKFGVVNGSNNDNSDNINFSGVGYDNVGVLGGVNVTAPGGNANWSNNVFYSVNGDNALLGTGPGTGTDNTAVVIYDTWGNWTPKFANDKLLLAFNIDLGNGDYGTPAGASSDTWWGAALYAKYKFTDVFSLAARGDYMHDSDGYKFGGAAAGAAGGNIDVWSYTLTAGFDVIENLTLRAEYRIDFESDAVKANYSAPAHMAAVQVVYSF